MLNDSMLAEALLEAQKQYDYAAMTLAIVKKELFEEESPRELNQTQLAKVLYDVSKKCFAKGYVTALLENNIKPPELKDGYFNTDYLKELAEQD